MITKRIIPCLDVKNGRVVKGVNFEGLHDVSSTPSNWPNTTPRAVRTSWFSTTSPPPPRAGASSPTSCAETASRGLHPPHRGRRHQHPGRFRPGAEMRGGQGQRQLRGHPRPRPHPPGRPAVWQPVRGPLRWTSSAWTASSASSAAAAGTTPAWRPLPGSSNAWTWGAGEIVVNSIDTDGVKGGFDLEMLDAVCNAVSVPVIASGGAGKVEDFTQLFQTLPGVDAGLAASVFHFGQIAIPDLKAELRKNGILYVKPLSLLRSQLPFQGSQ